MSGRTAASPGGGFGSVALFAAKQRADFFLPPASSPGASPRFLDTHSRARCDLNLAPCSTSAEVQKKGLLCLCVPAEVAIRTYTIAPCKSDPLDLYIKVQGCTSMVSG